MEEPKLKSIAERQIEFLHTWQKYSERFLNQHIHVLELQKKIKLSDSQRQNIIVKVAESSAGLEASIGFRDSLRFRDMGAGNGYTKGTRQNLETRALAMNQYKPRKQMKLINRPAFARLHWLQEVLGGMISDHTIIQSETITI